MNWKEYKEWFFRTYSKQPIGNQGCGGPVMMYGLMIAWCIMCLAGCSSVKSVESSSESRISTELSARMDSLLRATSTWQQSIYMQQSQLIDSFKHSEVRDTSHTIFLGVKGDTIRERIVIREYIEREHQSSEKSETFFEEKFRQTDSLLQVSLARQEKSDSLLRSYQKTTVVEKQLTFWQRVKQSLGGYAIVVCMILLLIVLYKIFPLQRKGL